MFVVQSKVKEHARIKGKQLGSDAVAALERVITLTLDRAIARAGGFTRIKASDIIAPETK